MAWWHWLVWRPPLFIPFTNISLEVTVIKARTWHDSIWSLDSRHMKFLKLCSGKSDSSDLMGFKMSMYQCQGHVAMEKLGLKVLKLGLEITYMLPILLFTFLISTKVRVAVLWHFEFYILKCMTFWNVNIYLLVFFMN